MGLAKFLQVKIDQHGETDLCQHFCKDLLINIGVIAFEESKIDYERFIL